MVNIFAYIQFYICDKRAQHFEESQPVAMNAATKGKAAGHRLIVSRNNSKLQ